MQHLEMQHPPVGPQGALVQAPDVLQQHPAASAPLPVVALQTGVVEIICAAGTAGGHAATERRSRPGRAFTSG
jgi:hypothetical protein